MAADTFCPPSPLSDPMPSPEPSPTAIPRSTPLFVFRAGGSSLVPALNIFGTILLFIWMNMEISCGFAEPGDRPLMIRFGSSVAQDLAISIAWNLVALGLIATGVTSGPPGSAWRGWPCRASPCLNRLLRYFQLQPQLYRVGALVGLAAIVHPSSFLYRKFNMKLRNRKKGAGAAAKS